MAFFEAFTHLSQYEAAATLSPALSRLNNNRSPDNHIRVPTSLQQSFSLQVSKLSKPPHYTGFKPKIGSAVIQSDKCISFDCVIFIQNMEYSSMDFLRILSARDRIAPSFK